MLYSDTCSNAYFQRWNLYLTLTCASWLSIAYFKTESKHLIFSDSLIVLKSLSYTQIWGLALYYLLIITSHLVFLCLKIQLNLYSQGSLSVRIVFPWIGFSSYLIKSATLCTIYCIKLQANNLHQALVP